MRELFDYLKTKKISVISPAGKIKKTSLAEAVDFFESHGVTLNIMPHVFDGESSEIYLASSLDNRLADFYEAWENSDIILCSRGGYGCAELASAIDWQSLKKSDTIVVGYSDVTALHMAMLKNKKGVCINGMMALKFMELINNQENATALLRSLRGEESLEFVDRLEFLKGSAANIDKKPKFVVANLAVLVSLCGTPLMPNLQKKILIVEDLNEPVYKLDRYLTQLAQNGILSALDGLIFGEFLDCGTADALDFVFNKFAGQINGVVAKNFPFGHGSKVYSLAFSEL